MTRPRLRLVAAALGLLLVIGACSKNDGDAEEVREFLDATELLAHRFVYTETTPSGGEVVVQGIVEDDFRRKALLSEKDVPVLEQVVYDDLAAVRFFEGKRLGRYLDKAVVSFIDTDTDRDGIDVFTALQSGNWVIDPGGAPPQIVAVDDITEGGLDPIFDATQMLELVRQITFIEGAFVRFSESSLTPTYRSDEDPFPKPEEGSGIVRYDVPQAPFPRTVDGAQLVIPEEYNFSKLAVFVRDGLIIRVSLDVGVPPTVLEDFETYMRKLIVETAPANVQEGFLATVNSLEGQELGQFLLDALNTVRDLQGDDPIRFRTATYELLDLGADDIEIEFPADGIEADLAVLLNLGVKPPVADDDGDDGVADPTVDDPDGGVPDAVAS